MVIRKEIFMINEFGLYKNTVPRWKIPGIISDRRLDDQTQGLWLPFFDENKDLYLVDTYHISTGYFPHKTDDFIQAFVKNNEEQKSCKWIIQKANYDYYYSGSVKVSDALESYFEEVCDLRDMCKCQGNPNEYLEKDIVRNVQFWFEHGYPDGITLRRKDAKLNMDRMAMARIEKAVYHYFFQSDIDELMEFAKDKSVSLEVREECKLACDYLSKELALKKQHDKNFTDYRDKVLQIPENIYPVPDESITKEDMHNYGYSWNGMLPLSYGKAKEFWNKGLPIYHLSSNDSEALIDELKDFEDWNLTPENLFGIEWDVWKEYCKKEDLYREK